MCSAVWVLSVSLSSSIVDVVVRACASEGSGWRWCDTGESFRSFTGLPVIVIMIGLCAFDRGGSCVMLCMEISVLVVGAQRMPIAEPWPCSDVKHGVVGVKRRNGVSIMVCCQGRARCLVWALLRAQLRSPTMITVLFAMCLRSPW